MMALHTEALAHQMPVQTSRASSFLFQFQFQQVQASPRRLQAWLFHRTMGKAIDLSKFLPCDGVCDSPA